ncbi:MAG: hypothetical protein KDB79_13685 [Acidobacteria bacterium]|nr:hypothetical protein [Acidobacteriota bacterium]
MKTIDPYLNNVYVDFDYLEIIKVVGDPNEKISGYTQTPGWRGVSRALVRNEEQRYVGSIILSEYDSKNAENLITLFHETIHAFSFQKGLGDIDADDYGGAESLSNQFVSMLGQLRSADSRFEKIKLEIESGKDQEAEITKLWKFLKVVKKNQTNFMNEKVSKLLKALGGKSQWTEYENALKLEFSKLKKNPKPAAKKGFISCPDTGFPFAYTNEKRGEISTGKFQSSASCKYAGTNKSFEVYLSWITAPNRRCFKSSASYRHINSSGNVMVNYGSASLDDLFTKAQLSGFASQLIRQVEPLSTDCLR